MAWVRNPGRLPDACVVLDEGGNAASYRKVRVKLRCGRCPAESWPAGGSRPPTRWSLTGDSQDILEFEVI